MKDVWLSAEATLRHVLAHELVPDVAWSKLERLVCESKIPVKAAHFRYLGVETSDTVIPSDFLAGPRRRVCIDFANGTARSLMWAKPATAIGPVGYGGYDDDYVPEEDSATGLTFSGRHLYSFWSGAPHRPKGTGKQRTDAELVKKMHGRIASGVANCRTEAARQVLKEDGKAHGQSEDATIKRLNSRYTEHYGD